MVLKSKHSHSHFYFENKLIKIPKSNRSHSRLYLDIINFKIPKSNRSQSAIEFLILMVAIVFFFTIFFVALNENTSDKIKEKQNLAVEEIAITVQDEINLASKSTDGYSREFKIPDNINGKDYDISITRGMVYVKTSDNKHAIALPVLLITGNVIKGDNLIKKKGGMVYLNPDND